VVEDVVGVVRPLHVCEPVVDKVAVRLANTVRAQEGNALTARDAGVLITLAGTL
jgi:hypothetical protein